MRDSMEWERAACGCLPGEIVCQEAARRLEATRRSMQAALVSGDWKDFEESRARLEEHVGPLRGRRAA